MSTHNKLSGDFSYALLAGFMILVIAVVAPVAEIYLYPKLVIPGNAVQTIANITVHRSYFVATIACYLVTFASDIVVSWALFIFLKPIHSHLSVLAAWFRLAFALLSLVALLNLVTVFRFLETSDYDSVFKAAALQTQTVLLLNTFRSNYHFALIFFAIHLGVVGYLVFLSNFIPKTIGVLLIICGTGYLLDALKPFLFPNLNTNCIMITFFGELVFMGWLVIMGIKNKLRRFKSVENTTSTLET